MKANIKFLVLVLTGSIYGFMLFVAANCNAASYPTSTATPITTDLSMNQYKLNDVGDIITKGPWVDARAYNGGAFNDVTISAAITAIGTTDKKTLLLAPGTWTISDILNPVTVPTNINLRFEQGAILSIGTGIIFTINGPIDAPLSQIFSGSGTVNIGSGSVKEAYSEWWGIDGTADEVEINKALSSAGCVRLLKKTYTTSAPITIGQGQILQGNGRNRTIISPATDTFAAITITGAMRDWFIKDLMISYAVATGGGASSNFSAIGIKLVTSGLDYPYMFYIDNVWINSAYRGFEDTTRAFMYQLSNLYVSTNGNFGIFIDHPSGSTTKTLTNCYVNGGQAGFFFRNIVGLIIDNCASDNLNSSAGDSLNQIHGSSAKITGFSAEANTVSNYRALMLLADSSVELTESRLIGNTLTGANGSYIVRVDSGATVRLEGVRMSPNSYSGNGTYSAIMPDSTASQVILIASSYAPPTGTGGIAYGIYPYSGKYVLFENNVLQEYAKPSFAVHKNGTNQTISSDIDTVVTWNSEDFDNSSTFASNRFTPNVSGKYFLSASVMYTSAVDRGLYQILLKKNGSVIKQVGVRASGTGSFSVSISIEVSANGTSDYFEISTQQGSGTDKIISGNSADTFFSGYMSAG